MNNKKISPPAPLIGTNLTEIIDKLFNKFYWIFLEKKSRPLFKNKFIFFNVNKNYKGYTLSYPERFMHLCSIEAKEKYTIFPCNNDIAYSLCKNKCTYKKALTEFQILGRTECPYRMSRIHWIPEIINLFNEGNTFIKNWQKYIKNPKTNNLDIYEFIRYEDDLYDYIIILREEKNKLGNIKMYTFITAYPVFYKRNKRDFDSQYNRYIKQQNIYR